MLAPMYARKQQAAADLEGPLPPRQTLPASDGSGSFLAPARRFDPANPELIDRPGMERSVLRDELRTMESCNQRLQGHELMLRYLQRFVDEKQPKSLDVLDLGTGIADIPRAIIAWCRQRRLTVKIVAVDRNPEVLDIAAESCREWPEIRFAQHDLRTLPFPANSFDLVLCSLTLHHFESADAIVLLRNMQTMARGGFLANDLRRSWLSIGSSLLLVPLLSRSSVFRQDAIQSCRAAFSVRELEAMSEKAGLKNFKIRRHHGVFRMVLEGRK